MSYEDTPDKILTNKYIDYFRGQHYQAFSKGGQDAEAQFGSEIVYTRTEYDIIDINLNVDEFTFLETKGIEIPLSSLPAGTTEPKWTTMIDFVKDFSSF